MRSTGWNDSHSAWPIPGRHIAARRFLFPRSPETILFPPASQSCVYDFEDDSPRPFQVEKLHRDYNSDVGMRVSVRERKRKRESPDKIKPEIFKRVRSKFEVGLANVAETAGIRGLSIRHAVVSERSAG